VSYYYTLRAEFWNDFATTRPKEKITLSALPKEWLRIFLAAEGPRFLECDRWSVLRDIGLVHFLKHSIKYDSSCGITLSLVRLSAIESQRAFPRHWMRMVGTYQLHSQFSNLEIIEEYLSRAYFGKGAYGIGAGAELYFHKKPAELDKLEVAGLMGIMRSPDSYSPLTHPDRYKERRENILERAGLR
jgi:membrane carboxypeptidase/penicillin-binding protein